MNPSAAACDQCIDYQEGACQQQCGWGEHDSESCRASKCEWTQATANSQPYCTDKVFLPPPAVDQQVTAKPSDGISPAEPTEADSVAWLLQLQLVRRNIRGGK